ncbi:MAG: gamma-glutamyl-gamma-aminobutyrate hydrolase family protein [Microbacterium sp.]
MRLAILHLRDERPHDPGFQRELDALNGGALAAARHLGWRAQLVPTATMPLDEVLHLVRESDGVLLMGGEDVDPSFYDGPTDYPRASPHERVADIAFFAAVHEAAIRMTPLLGICRGHQALNVALGGTLVPHLAHPHLSGDAAWPFIPSDIRVEESLKDDVHGTPLCSHHQAIDRLGADLLVAARAADGTIEAVVHDHLPITGVQWHPEHPDVALEQLVPLLHRLQRQR